MIAVYRPGTGFLYRLPAPVKLAGLAVIALALSLWRAPSVAMVVAAVAATVLLWSTGSLRDALRSWWQLRWLILVLGAALWVFVDVQTAIVNTLRVVTLLLLAETVSRTTRMQEVVDVLVHVLQPARRFGANPEAVALAVSLTVAMVPTIAAFAQQVGDAHAARGRRIGLRSALPLLVMTLRHADEVGDALIARGIAR